MSELCLADLVGPMTPEAFYERCWRPQVPFIGAAAPGVVERILQFEGLQNIEALLKKVTEPVSVFGPKKFRSMVPPSSALDFLGVGFNLYVSAVERALPGVTDLFAGIAADLGLPPWQLSVEAFAGRAGGISTRHYDHDINFQVLLDGTKRWRLEPNLNVQNPMHPYHPRPLPNGAVSGIAEEVYAAKSPVPHDFDPNAMTEHEVSAGSVVFLPRGHWHEVDSLTTTWSVNIVFKGITWAQALGAAIANQLHADPRFRDYVSGVGYGARSPLGEGAQAEAQFAELKAAALEAVQELTRNEVALSLLASVYRWVPQATQRRVTETADGFFLDCPGLLDEPIELDPAMAPVVRRLVAIREQFSWPHALAVGRSLTATGLHNLLGDLVDVGLLEQHERPKKPVSP